MKLYDFTTAPSPRRVRVFMAEKGIEIPTEQVDLRAQAQFDKDYSQNMPRPVVPMLVLDDGSCIAESWAICHYLEGIEPSPNLLGASPLERARVEEWNRRCEFEGYLSIADAYRNSQPFFAGRALPGADGDIAQIPALAERGQMMSRRYFAMLDSELGKREFIAGDRFTAADITAMIAVDFAHWIKLDPDPDTQPNLCRWYDTVRARPSATA